MTQALSFTAYDIIGLIGVIISVGCYARLQWHRDFAKNLSYSLLNVIATALMLISLWKSFNLASTLSNAAWLLISIYGVYRCLNYRWREKHVERPESAQP